MNGKIGVHLWRLMKMKESNGILENGTLEIMQEYRFEKI